MTLAQLALLGRAATGASAGAEDVGTTADLLELKAAAVRAGRG